MYSEIKVVIAKENAANAEIHPEVKKPPTSGRSSAFSGHFPTLHCKIILPSTLVEVGRMLAETSHPCLRVHGCAWFMVPDTLFTHDSLI